MADILIKLDKGIPKTHESLVIDEDNEVRIFGTDVVIGEAIELPPHGRLVALDDVIELLGSGISLDTQADRDWAIELAERLPIIVEASNGTDN